MLKHLLVAGVSTILLPLITAAQTIIPGGNVNGLWEFSGSPYNIEGEITIPAGDTLTIESGVEVVFQGHYKFIINGFLEAAGTENDSILFTSANPDTGWGGIRFLDALDSNQLFFCVIQYGRATGSSPDNHGGGIYCDNSNPVIAHSSIRNNYSEAAGGGIYCLENSNPSINHCVINNNTAVLDGGGIHCWEGAEPTVSYCTIFANTGNYGGGVFCGNNSDLTIVNCTISRNTAIQLGGAVNCYNANPAILNTVIEGNLGSGGVNIHNAPGISISYCDLSNNQGGNLIGNTIPPGAGQLIFINTNLDSCDIFFNIFEEPLFEDPLNGNYNLTWINYPVWDNTRSPCIDAGNPDQQYLDPDSTTADIGASYFDQSTFPPVPEIVVSSQLLDFETVRIGNQADLPLTIYNNGNRYLILYDINSSSLAFSTNFNPLDSLILPTDSLLITVYFDPDDTLSYNEILSIDNDDELVEVELLGIGEEPSEPNIQITADSLDFGSVIVGTQSSLPFTIYNVGDTTLVLYDLTANDPAFTTNFDLADSLILPNDSLMITVTFAPVEIISYSDTLRIDNNDELVELSLIGAGVSPPAPDISVSGYTLDFGALLLGAQETLPLTIYNMGNADLILYEMTTSDTAFTMDYDPADSLIAPGDSLNIIVYFTPSQIAFYQDTLTIESNDEIVLVALEGEGIGPVQITLTPYSPPIIIPESGGSFDFNIAVENLTSVEQIFDLWTIIRLPQVGEVPIMTVANITIPGNTVIDRDRTQFVPEIAPSGTYTYYAYVGNYPWVINDYDTFNFEKQGNNVNCSMGAASDWLCTGENFYDLFPTSNMDIPTEYILYYPYPNPFNPVTTFKIELPVASWVTLEIYDVSGRSLGIVIDDWRLAGYYEVTFDGSRFVSGIYIYKLSAGDFISTGKIVLMK
ncbi:hypothetical protein CEE37_12160 [candidate division LCP-89 bacterium B3_LCP]|uniref:Secretion system C-terminal sorting domain-containing protein n=1 Tax=candidate division LCP-89 bacterium B3_LCP TaxID=2012998 RepID=A0A532UU96_UNCL8|nr:MAG: hypothetical protein CEE37_12160 [candidate division LCP-89 bacterium B3_LCP]